MTRLVRILTYGLFLLTLAWELSSPKEVQLSLKTLIEKIESLEFLTSSQML